MHWIIGSFAFFGLRFQEAGAVDQQHESLSEIGCFEKSVAASGYELALSTFSVGRGSSSRELDRLSPPGDDLGDARLSLGTSFSGFTLRTLFSRFTLCPPLSHGPLYTWQSAFTLFPFCSRIAFRTLVAYGATIASGSRVTLRPFRSDAAGGPRFALQTTRAFRTPWTRFAGRAVSSGKTS